MNFPMTPKIKSRLLDVMMGSVAIAVGVIVNALGNHWTGAHLEFFGGIQSFDYAWATTLFFVPFVAGIPVALLYGFGGKLLAMLPPLILGGYNYLQVYSGNIPVPDGYILLPFIYWALVVVVAMEFCAAGGLVGEVIIKRTYGRSPKNQEHLIHKHRRDREEDEVVPMVNKSSEVER